VSLPFVPGPHTLQWTSSDAAGNAETIKSATYDMLARTDDADPRIVYKGTWTPNVNASRYAGAWKTSTATTQKAYVTFTGSRFELLASTGPAYGIARITIDGAAPETGDLYTSAYKHIQRVYSKSGLSNSRHTAVIEWTGTKNPASTGTGIGIDAIDIAGTLDGDTVAPVTTDDVSSAWRTTAATVTLSATDAHSFVSATRYRINGSAVTTYTAPFSVSTEGTNTIEYWSVDGAGNTEATKTATVRIDKTAPAVSDDAPAVWTKGPVTLHVTSLDTASGVASVVYSTDGSAPSLPYTGSIVIGAEGTTTVKYQATDSLGNATSVRTTTVRVDDTAPSSSDDASTGWISGTANVHLTSTDALSGVTGISFTLDGSDPATYETPITVSGEGTHTITYAAIDAAGNTEATKTVTVRIDDTAPTSTDDAPVGWVSGPVFVTLTPVDPISGVNAVLYSTDGSEPNVPYTGPIVVAAQGVTTIRYAAIDTKGNVEPTRLATVSIDDVAPVTTDNAPSAWIQGPVDVTLSVVEQTSGLAFTDVTVDGSASTYTEPLHLTTEGTHTITYASTDVKGNRETTKTVIARVDDTAPVTTVTTVSPTYAATATATLLATDGLSGVTSTKWRLDGGAWTTGTAVSLPFVPGPHTLQWTSSDAAGNAETVKNATYDMLARTDDADPRIVYKGTWTPNVNASRYAGAWKTSTATTQKAYVTFTGSRFELLASTGPAYGIARITIDGAAPETGDLYSSAYKHIQRVYSKSGLSNSRHTAVIEWTGTKNPASTGTGIGIDAIDIAGTLDGDTVAPVTTDDVSSAWRTTAATVTLSATDVHSFVSATRYRINGSAVTTYTAPFSVSSEGTNTIEYWSVDGAGNTEATKTATVRIDKTAPAVSDDAPAVWTKGPAAVHLSAEDAGCGVASILYSLDGSQPGLPYSGQIDVSTQGTTTVRYVAVDSLGNTSSVKTATVRLDDTAPVTSDDAPIGWSTSPVSITLISTDDLAGVSHASWTLDGSDPVTYETPITVSGEGTHTITYAATDAAGNTEATKTVTVRIDDTAPTSTDDAPVGWVSGPVFVTLTPVDPISGVNAVLYSTDGSEPNVPYTGPIVVASQGVPGIKSATRHIQGNVDTHQTTTVSIDDVAPVTTDNAPTGWAKGPIDVVLTVVEETSGLSTTEFVLDGIHQTYSSPITISTEGSHTLTYASVDNKGNAEATKTVTFKLDNVSPVTTSSALASYFGTATITLSATDALSGVTNTEYRLDDGPWIVAASLTTTASGPHVLQFRSSDLVGNTEQTRIANFDVSTRFDDADPRIVYKGTWTPNVNASRYAGAWKTSTATTQKAYVTFTGSRFELLASTGPAYGIARITIDGAAPETGDLYTSAYKHIQRVYSKSGLSNSRHTAVIEWTGTKNPASTGTGIGIDAIDIAGTLDGDTVAPVTTDDVSSAWRTTAATVTLSATDAHSFVSATRYRINGSAVTTYTAPFSVSAEGTNTIEYWSVDGAGNTETTKTATVRIDKTAPAVSDDSSSAWAKGPVTLHVTSLDTASGGASVVYSTDGSAPSLPYTGSIVIGAEGTTTVKYQATDSLGNATSVRTATVRVDDTAPSSSDDAPTGWISGTANVHLTSTDALSGVTGISFTLDGSDPVTYETPITVSGEGTHTITYAATDAAGNTEATKTVTLRIDDTAPASTITTLSPVYTGAAVATISASDALSGIGAITWRIDSGAWSTGGLVALPYAPGWHTLSWSATDQAGNATTSTATYEMVGRLDDSDTRILYLGSWTPNVNSGRYQGSWRVASNSTSKASVTFVGTRIMLIGSTAPNYGIAKVTLDGNEPQYVDFYTSGYKHLRTVFSATGLTNSKHRITVEWSGSKNALSTGYSIGIDAIDVAGQTEDTLFRAEQTEMAIAYSGNWTTSQNPLRSGGSWATAVSDATAYISFSGRRLDIIGSKAPTYGIAMVTIDGGQPHYIDFYSSSYKHQQSIWSISGLTDAPHTLTIAWTGTKNVASSGSAIGIDSLDVAGTLLQATVPGPTTDRYEETSPLLAYEGNWTSNSNSARSAGSWAYGDSNGMKCFVNFTGTYMSVVGSKAPTYGIAKITVDDGPAEFVDLYSSSFRHQTSLWAVAQLTDGPHNVLIEWTGTKNAASSGTAIGVDAIDVAGKLTQASVPTPQTTRYEETNGSLLFEGAWTANLNALRSDGAWTAGNSAGLRVQTSFTGTYIALIGSKAPSYGIARITVDGGTPVYADFYAASFKHQQRVWQMANLPEGPHSVVVEWSGTKNAASTGTAVGIDALDIAGELTPLP